MSIVRRRRRGTSEALVIASDTFTRSDSINVIGSAEIGGAWALLIGGNISEWGIINNQAYTPAQRNNETIYLTTAVSNCTVSVNLAVWNGQMGLWCRISDSLNYIRLLEAGGTIYLEKFVANASTILGTAVVALASGDKISLVMSGSSLIAKRNGVTIITASDAFNSTAMGHGFGFSTGSITARWDNFLVTVP